MENEGGGTNLKQEQNAESQSADISMTSTAQPLEVPSVNTEFNTANIYPNPIDSGNSGVMVGVSGSSLGLTNQDTEIESRGVRKTLTILFSIILALTILVFLVQISIPILLGRIVGGSAFIFGYSPVYFYSLLVPAAYSIYLFYLLLKLRFMTRVSWILALIAVPLCFINSFMNSFALKNITDRMAEIAAGMTGAATGTTQTAATTGANYGIGLGTLLIITILILLIFFFNKFKSEKSKITTRGLIFFLTYSVLVGGFAVFYVFSSWLGSNETPFIGYSKAESYLGEKPVYFTYLPEGINVEGMPGNKNGSGQVIMSINDTGVNKDFSKWIIIKESTQKPDTNGMSATTQNGKDYYELSKVNDGVNLKGSRRIIVFKYNNVWVGMTTVEDTLITRSELLRIAESANQ